MTTLVVLQPGYLPWLGYFDLMSRADVFVHYDDVPFDKHGWRNRNRVKAPKGPLWLTVPVLHSGRGGQRVCDVEIDVRQPWQRKHLASVDQLYTKSAYFRQTMNGLQDIIDRPWQRLLDLDIVLIEWLKREFNIETPCHFSSSIKVDGDRNERLINLCRRFEATTYLSGPAAKDYINIRRFEEAGIGVQWHDYVHPVYPQLHGPFVPCLSALDLLLNLGAQARDLFKN